MHYLKVQYTYFKPFESYPKHPKDNKKKLICKARIDIVIILEQKGN